MATVLASVMTSVCAQGITTSSTGIISTTANCGHSAPRAPPATFEREARGCYKRPARAWRNW